MKSVTALFRMTDDVWERHANPWSVWTRYSALPLLGLAAWSRIWWGWWSVAPIAIVIAWIWLNPRLFAKPASTRNWASKAVLGERVGLNRSQRPIPEHHHPVIAMTNIINSVGFLVCLWGLVQLAVWPTVMGLSWVILGKTWFLDRMVWLYDEVGDRYADYQTWLY